MRAFRKNSLVHFCFWISISFFIAPFATAKSPGKIGFLSEDKDVAAFRFYAMMREKKEVFATYYLWDGDRMGVAALSVLRDLAKNGVKVKLVLDGSSTIQMQKLPKYIRNRLEAVAPIHPITLRLMKALKEDGVEIRLFNPPRLENGFIQNLPPYLNTRSHNKIAYLGSQGLVLAGDRNWQSVNFQMLKEGKAISKKRYRSVEAVFTGRETLRVRSYLQKLWDSKKWVKEPILDSVKNEDVGPEKRMMDRYVKIIREQMGEHSLSLLPESQTRLMDLVHMHDAEAIHFAADMPGEKRVKPGMEVDIYRMLSSAKNRITIVSPYIVFSARFKQLIKQKALIEKVKVDVLTPVIENTDSPISTLAFALQVAELRKWGVVVHQHNGTGLLHAKMIRVDDDKVSIMAHNLDVFSEYFNYESGVFVENKGYASIVGAFIDDITKNESKPFELPKAGMKDWLLGRMLKAFSEKLPLPEIQL